MDQEAKNSHMLRLRKAVLLQPRIRMTGGHIVLACLVLAQAVAAAERFPASPPLPVPRPRFEAPAANAPPAPSPTPPTLAAPLPAATPPLSTELPPNDPIVRLGAWPREEQREILRRCASEWDRMKREGTTKGMIWRDFLDSCLPDH
jgi:hypothetical protein